MDRNRLKKCLMLSRRLGSIKLVTRDQDGDPFVEHFGKMELIARAQVALDGWFFPQTLENLEVNKELCIIVWDAGVKEGFELLGRLVMIEDLAHANGRAKKENSRIPHCKKQMIVDIKSMIELNQDNYLLLTEEASLLR